jgi:hypothetical protein
MKVRTDVGSWCRHHAGLTSTSLYNSGLVGLVSHTLTALVWNKGTSHDMTCIETSWSEPRSLSRGALGGGGSPSVTGTPGMPLTWTFSAVADRFGPHAQPGRGGIHTHFVTLRNKKSATVKFFPEKVRVRTASNPSERSEWVVR